MIFRKIKINHFDFIQIKRLSSSYKPPRSRVDPYKTSKLLSDYFKLGAIEEAEKLFDEIPKKNIVSWSILVHGYAINECHWKCMESFSRMRVMGSVPNSFTVVGLLVGVKGLRDSALGQSVHGLIVKSGLQSDSVVGTALLDTYAKCGNIYESYKLFQAMENPGLVSCNAMVSGCINHDLFEEGVVLFNGFRKSGLVPNESTVLSILRGYVALGSRIVCKSFHGLIVKLGLVSDISVENSLLDMYSHMVDLEAVYNVFDEMEHKDVISWATVMGLLINLECVVDVLNLFVKMRATQVDYDTIVLMNLILACTVLGDLKRGRQIHGQAVVSGFDSGIPLANSLITMYSKCGNLDCSRAVFDQLTWKSLVSWTAMITGCLQNRRPGEALNLLVKVRLEENYPLDSAMIVNALTASAEVAAFELCQQLHCHIIKAGFPHYRPVQNSLISAYSKCGDMDLAQRIFQQMDSLRDIVSWNAIINGYGINGQGETALALYLDMRKDGENPDSATYLSILSACSHSGMIQGGLMIFKQIVEDNRVIPSQEHFACIVDLLARVGCLSEASELLGNFLELSSPIVLRALLSGCMVHGNVDLAEIAAKKLFEQEPDESGHVVLLSNVYASVGRFQDAEALRMNIQKKGLMKNPGISLISENSSSFY